MKIFRLILIFVLLQKFGFAQTTYYISNEGNDKNDGLSPASSWNYIKSLRAGCTYLFKRGDVFYFKIPKVRTSTDSPIKLNSYGKGRKPIISLYKNIHKTSWVMEKPAIWKVNLTDTTKFGGFMDINDTNVGFLKVDNTIKGNKVTSLDGLKSRWDFYSDNQMLYVYSETNPADLASSIGVVSNHNIIQLSDNLEIANLTLNGTGGHGIQGSGITNVKIRNCDINEIGGSYLKNFKDGKVRYGNGIEFYSGAANCLVYSCKVTQVYDAAFTMQSREKAALFYNVIFRDNVSDKNEQSFEFWTESPFGRFESCAFINNSCYNAGYGWSHSVRPDKGAGVHLLNYYHNFSSNDLKISGNTFSRAKSGYLYLKPKPVGSAMFKAFGNKIYLNGETPLEVSDSLPFTKSTKSFKGKFQIEKGSVFRLLKPNLNEKN